MKLKKFTPILLSTMLLASCALLPTGKQGGNSSTSGNITSNTSGSGTGSSSSSSSSEEGDPKVTSVTLSETAKNMKPGALATLTATVTGDAGIDKTVTWESSNTGVATVSNGTVTVASGATSGNKATITATSNQDSSKKASCEITVVASESYTILMYIVGSNLESQQGGQASADLNEILGVNGQPSDVNIVVQTGGADSWNSSPGVASGVNRYTIRNKSLGSATNVGGKTVNMGSKSTLQSFLTWGIQNYRADHMALIMWNHGGAVSGCCFDENNQDDGILPNELASAMTSAKSAASFTGKFDWVGYDCCIMSYADLASVNAQHFKYMVSSQELENGTGWDYDSWLPSLYNNTSIETPTLLKNICDSFVSTNGGTSSSNDQCLSVLNLQNMDALTSSFDSFASGLSSSDWTKISNLYNSSLRFGYLTDDYGHGLGYGYGICDMKEFLTKASSTYSYNTSSILTALNNVTVSSSYGGYYSSKTKPCGLNVFVPADDEYVQISEDEYGSSDTKLTNWRSFCIANGTFYTEDDNGGWW